MSKKPADKKNVAEASILNTMTRFYKQAAMRPDRLALHSMSFGTEMLQAMMGNSSIAPEKGDRRFNDDAFEKNPAYKAMMQSYLAWTREMDNWVQTVGLSDRDTERAQSFFSTMSDTFAPTNMLLGNPAALEKTLETGGQNLIEGAKNFLHDMKHNHGRPSQVDKSKFKVGDNVAVTKGDVVFRDEVLELIRYTPQTDTVYDVPMFIVPPPISKYYIFDLSPQRSMIEYYVQQGYQVYAVSWFNPGKEQSEWGLDTYVKHLANATGVACEVSGCKKLHVVGACAGGVSAIALAGYLAGKDIDRVETMTLMVAILDVSTTADTAIGLFAHRDTLEMAVKIGEQQGVIPGHVLQTIFAFMRPNDLVWSYWVNNYLMGNTPPAFDILFWNADAMNLSPTLQADLISLLNDNPLCQVGGMVIDGVPIDLSKVKCDSFIVAGETDHITPWEGCYKSMEVFGGKKEFILTNSGHVQSIVAPPPSKKMVYYTNTGKHTTPEAFLDKAKAHEGSWWGQWDTWLAKRSGKRTAENVEPKTDKYPSIGAAPGTYVLEK